jgi:hypothetical protein
VHDTLREGQNSDIWSLGCIYSEAARWLTDGHRGIQAYRQERQRETSQIQGFRDRDCFHDGEKLLTCVRQCHKNSVRNLRPEDFITRHVVEALIGDMLGTAEARSTAYRLYLRSRQLAIDAKADLEAAITEPEPSSLPKFPGRARNRNFTVPNHDFSPPAPPNPPPGFCTSQYVLPNNNSPPHILNPSDTTSEPEGVENLRLSPTSPAKSHSPRESQSAVPTNSSPYHPPPDTTAETTIPQRSPSTRHTATESIVRPKPLIIQGPPKLPNLSLEDALEWRRKRRGNGPKTQLKDWQYLDRLKERDHVSVPWTMVILSSRLAN